MTLPAPKLDDREFQDLVDEAKRRIQSHHRGWTDHNVSDPGITMVETFAWMTDQLLYRLNRVPERNYIKFLELIGIRLLPPVAARSEVTFWLSSSQPEARSIPRGTQVATRGTREEAPVIFETTEDLVIVSSRVGIRSQGHTELVLTSTGGENYVDRGEALKNPESGFRCFDTTGGRPGGKPPEVGDALVIGLEEPAPSCAVSLQMRCTVQGQGVDPDDPPLKWQARHGTEWIDCELESDTTGGLNRDGEVLIHLPQQHSSENIQGEYAGWIRAVIVPTVGKQPDYTASPLIHTVSASVLGGTAPVTHAELIEDEFVGTSEGIPGQVFELRRQPVLPSTAPRSITVDGEPWTDAPAGNFADSGPNDKDVVIDAVAGTLTFGPAIRLESGGVRHHGAVPPAGAEIRIPEYSIGGGIIGNVAAWSIGVLKSSIAYVSRVENRTPAAGGVDGEDIEAAKLRAPILLRTRDRAVTAEDYVSLAREAAPELSRVECLTAGDGAKPGTVQLLVVPTISSQEQVPYEELEPDEETRERLSHRLEDARLVGTVVQVGKPRYVGAIVIVTLRARPHVDGERLRVDALAALYRYLHPTLGGPDANGWPFGRPVVRGELFGVLGDLPGTEYVEKLLLYGADAESKKADKEPSERLDLERDQIVLSREHVVTVV